MASFIKVSTFLAILASLHQVAVAAPPACLLACVAQETKSSSCSGLNDLSCICSVEYSDIESCLESICPNGNADAAKSAFESSCSGYSKDVVSSSSAKSSSSTEEASSTEASSTEASSVSASSTETAAAEEASSTETAATQAPSTQQKSPLSTAAQPTTLSSSGVAEETSSGSFAPAISTQTEAGANKVGLGALIGLVGAALL
ncbi:SSR1 [Candida oxycetoniae]|uniref:SSR1 n=1 Tax=Candida oxycetoniae TaxID=497107 RepID=A0AAI9WYG5_9ASCO|nr:SSR1 [Candida oxycetoniae]KAI3405119.1 SSR1 [Candida oxycetoniae]